MQINVVNVVNDIQNDFVNECYTQMNENQKKKYINFQIKNILSKLNPNKKIIIEKNILKYDNNFSNEFLLFNCIYARSIN